MRVYPEVEDEIQEGIDLNGRYVIVMFHYKYPLYLSYAESCNMENQI